MAVQGGKSWPSVSSPILGVSTAQRGAELTHPLGVSWYPTFTKDNGKKKGTELPLDHLQRDSMI